jgi:hypothetical protein
MSFLQKIKSFFQNLFSKSTPTPAPVEAPRVQEAPAPAPQAVGSVRVPADPVVAPATVVAPTGNQMSVGTVVVDAAPHVGVSNKVAGDYTEAQYQLDLAAYLQFTFNSSRAIFLRDNRNFTTRAMLDGIVSREVVNDLTGGGYPYLGQ